MHLSNSKLRCKHCRDYFPRLEMVKFPSGRFCNINHAQEWATDNRAIGDKKIVNQEKKDHALRKKVFKANDLKLRKVSAQSAFNAFIRQRDAKLPCISCQRHHQGQYHAGHYKTVGAHSQLRFNEDNCHKQCSVCNNHRSGNIEQYTPNLIKKIGKVRFDALTSHKEIKKITCEEYKFIELNYKQRLKELT